MTTANSTPRKRSTAGKVTITMDEIYQGQLAQGEAITSLAETIKDGFHEVNSKLDLQIQEAGQVKEQVKDHETRIRSVEKQSWKTKGFSAGIGAVVSALGLFLGNIFHITK